MLLCWRYVTEKREKYQNRNQISEITIYQLFAFLKRTLVLHLSIRAKLFVGSDQNSKKYDAAVASAVRFRNWDSTGIGQKKRCQDENEHLSFRHHACFSTSNCWEAGLAVIFEKKIGIAIAITVTPAHSWQRFVSSPAESTVYSPLERFVYFDRFLKTSFSVGLGKKFTNRARKEISINPGFSNKKIGIRTGSKDSIRKIVADTCARFATKRSLKYKHYNWIIYEEEEEIQPNFKYSHHLSVVLLIHDEQMNQHWVNIPHSSIITIWRPVTAVETVECADQAKKREIELNLLSLRFIFFAKDCVRIAWINNYSHIFRVKVNLHR